MKAYGTFRSFQWPDVGDIQEMASPSRVGRLRGRGGDYRGYVCSNNKAATRRLQKKRTRAAARAAIRSEVQ